MCVNAVGPALNRRLLRVGAVIVAVQPADAIGPDVARAVFAHAVVVVAFVFWLVLFALATALISGGVRWLFRGFRRLGRLRRRLGRVIAVAGRGRLGRLVRRVSFTRVFGVGLGEAALGVVGLGLGMRVWTAGRSEIALGQAFAIC